jgi:hypothetical protein
MTVIYINDYTHHESLLTINIFNYWQLTQYELPSFMVYPTIIIINHQYRY